MKSHFPRTWTVYRSAWSGRWWVIAPRSYDNKNFLTHAEAIAYADRMARGEKP